MSNTKFKLLTLLLAAMTLTACGGGDSSPDIIQVDGPGGDSNPPPPDPDPPMDAGDPFPVSDAFNMGTNNFIAAPGLAASGVPTDLSPDLQAPTFQFEASSGDLQNAAFQLPATLGPNFELVDYIGAFAQDSADNWTQGWTVSINGNTTVWEPAQGGTLAGGVPSADDTCPVGTTDVGDTNLPSGFNGNMDFCQLNRRYDTDGSTLDLTNDNVYLLASGFPGTYIGNGEAADGDASNDVTVTLNIEQGTLILGSNQEALVITRGSNIQATGTAVDPIVMSSNDQFSDWVQGSDGTSGRGEWAGLALMGYAESNECGTPCDVNAEGNIGAYGGTNNSDNSGTMNYVVVRHAGNDIDGNGNELNGLTYFATGSGTRSSFIQVHKGLDDGVEHFGASDFMDHVVLTDNRDDSFDWGQGYTGGAQFVVIKQAADDADRGIEADNDGDSPDIAPRSNPSLANFTIIGDPNGDPNADGVLLRRGTGAQIYNFLITGFADACLDVDGAATEALFAANDGLLQIHNTILNCPTSVDIEDDGDVAGTAIQAWFDADANNDIFDPNLNANGVPNPTTGAGSNFVSTNYVGAFAQDADDNWTDGWTISVNGNNTVWTPAVAPVADGTCPAETTANGTQDLPASVGGGTMDICQLNRRHETDGTTITLTADNVYTLASGFPGTYIGNGDAADGDATNDVSVTLVIDPGTLIIGDNQEALVITRGSQIQANGTAANPIVMTSREQFDAWVAGGDGSSGRGEWAGLALMGYARSNECGTPCDVNAEGNIGAYGGTDDTDNSGSLNYVVIRHAGNDIDGNGNELNGLTFFATGSGTRSSYIQVHNGLDDGVEHFGATDFMDHVVLTGNRDDSFDWGQGYTGGAQFILIIQADDDADRGIEADNDGDAPDATPVSKPVLANMTMIGSSGASDDTTIGILLRRGTGAEISNSIITGFDICIDFDDDATFEEFDMGNIAFENSIVDCPVNFDEETGDDDGGGDDPGVGGDDPLLVSDVFNMGNNNRVLAAALNENTTPGASSPDLQGSTFAFTASSPDLQDATFAIDLGGSFEAVDYVGAFPQDGSNWTEGWTVSINGNNTVWAPAQGGTLAGATPAADDVCPAGTTDIGNTNMPPGVSGSMDLCQLSRRYDTDASTLALTNENVYVLASGFPGTYIGNGEAADGDSANDVSVALTIEPGTLILGSNQEALVITRGSTITASGTAVDPIVMTSNDQFGDWVQGSDGTSGRGEWAGLAIMGYARSNECGTPCDVNAEGNIGAYGGTDDADSSGTMEYVVIRHAGNDIDGNGNELNGLTFFATGSGTRSSYIQVHKGLDDGVEHFGATDFMDHVVLTANRDDSFDWGQGYTGGAQFVVIEQAADDADRGIEADNDGDAPDIAPRSNPTLANFTIIGDPNGDPSADGILLRRGTGAQIYNFIVTGFLDACLDVDGAATEALFGNNDGLLQIHNTYLFCPDGLAIEDDGDVAGSAVQAWFDADSNNLIANPNLTSDGTPNSTDGAGNNFISTNYIGAFEQDSGDNWTTGWTIDLNGNTTVWEPAVAPVADGTCPAGTTAAGTQDLPATLGGGTMDLCQLNRRYNGDGLVLTLTNDNVYALASGFPGTYIGNGDAADGDSTNDVSVSLEIEAGTLIIGDNQEALVITRGSNIQALGTAEDPIVMTSRDQFDAWLAGGDGSSGRGEWAGLAIMGYAQSNECGTPCDVNAEGNIGAYGGTDDTDNSGTMRYVVIRHAGNDIDGNGNELNGLTFFATGSGTRSSFIQVHNGLDDGVEHFGATDFMDHVVLTGNRDDSFDWGQGYTGGVQFMVIKQADDDADRGIEADNDGDAPDATPISRPVLANMTLVGSSGAADDTTIGVLLRRGTGAEIWNSIITGFDKCLDLDDDATFTRYENGDIAINNVVLSCDINFEEE